jgi:hypothetical protein
MIRNRYQARGTAVAALALALGSHACAASPDLMSREMCKDMLPQVASAYAGILAPVQRAGHCLAGDFNGDGKPDVLMVVKVLVAKVPAVSGVKTLYTFYSETARKGRLQFLVLHSKANSTTPELARYDKLLLDGESPILVLRHEDMTSDMERIGPRARAVKELQLSPRRMRGDAVLLGTEAVEAILYWNGTRYVLHEDPAGP